MIVLAIIITLLVLYFFKSKPLAKLSFIVKTLPRDAVLFWGILKTGFMIIRIKINKDNVPKIFNKMVRKYPNKIMFYFEDEKWTYREMDQFSNQIANYFKSKGFKKGDAVALLLENRPEYFGIFLGLSKIGVIAALINTNLMSEVLIHVINVAKSKAIIYGSEYSKVVADILPSLTKESLFELGDSTKTLPESIDLKTEMASQPITTPNDINDIELTDSLAYIYTSGTTGLPKAAIIKHYRYMHMSYAVRCVAQISENDTIYNPLPLYHSSGIAIFGSHSVLCGTTVVLKRKFSATNYFKDCERFNCTVGTYIGEMCRYLLAAHKPGDKITHNVKKMIGNGLRPQIWKQFADTFHIKQIYEAYASTEGNAAFVNTNNKVGPVGYFPCFMNLFNVMTLVRCNKVTGEPLRNEKGLCIECKAGEPGLLLAKVHNNSTIAAKKFDGYTDIELTNKKILTDVLERGDFYFNTGDILEKDELNYLYFKDRTGDTFRWKGENVSTHEIESLISNFLEFKNVAVYGVQIPNTEGKAGMVAIAGTDDEFDLKKLANFFKSKLPTYAIPLFLRKLDSIQLTGTFKIQKVKLQLEGYNINEVKDKLYFFDSKLGQYIELTNDLYNNIINGNVRV